MFTDAEFSSMTFERATDFTYPKIVAPNSVISISITVKISLQVLQGQLTFWGNPIPNSIVEDDFGKGKRTFFLTMKLADSTGSQNTYEYQLHITFVHWRLLIFSKRVTVAHSH